MGRLLPGAMMALVTLFFAEGQRAYFGSLFGLAYDALFPAFRPVATALAALPLLVVLAPLVPLARWTDRRTAIAACAIGVAVSRMLMTDPGHAARLVGGGLVVAFAAAFLTWAVGRLDRRAVAAGAVLGLVVDQLLRLAGASYDLSLQPGWLPVQAVLSLGLAAAAWGWHHSESGGPREVGLERRAGGLRLRGGLALGALLFIDLHILSTAVVARAAGLPFGTAGVGLGLAGAIALWLALARPRPTAGRGATLALVGLIAGATLASPYASGMGILAGLSASHGAALLLVTRAVEPASGRRSGMTAAAGLGTLILGVALYGLTFYAAFTVPALAGGAPWILAAAALLLAGCFFLMPQPADLEGGTVTLPAVAGLAVVLAAVGLAWPTPSTPAEPPAATGSFRIVTWNVHFGFDEAWTFAPERVARALAREEPDIVAIQEAIVGGPTAYGIDLPFWLGRTLGLENRFSPTVNGLLGEAFLAPAGIGDTRTTALPAGKGEPKQLIQLELRGPDPVTINALHLSVRADVRAGQIRAALDGIPTRPAVVLGDLNAGPTSPVIDALRSAGFSDAFGGSGPPTFPAARPTIRIDWIWTRGVSATEAAVLMDSSSDHRAVAATLHIRPAEVRSSGKHDLQAPEGPALAGPGSWTQSREAPAISRERSRKGSSRL